jgi:Protein kinase domain
MSSLPTPPRLGLRVPLPPAPREGEEPAADELRPGQLLEGRYQIEHRLGEGGVGFVYRARQINLHRRVAIKLLQQDVMGDEELRPRFEREALTLAALSHPNIVSLTDYGAVQGRPYLVMELLEGRTLRDILDHDGALEVGRALALVRQVLLALAYAHELGIVHRDLKPANLLVQALPSHEHVKVLDFGLVKLLPGSYLDRGVQLSRVGFTFGTPAYMSPEHATGAEVDGRSDLYALGVLVFELLSGQKPFDGELQDILRAHFTAPVPKLAERNPALARRADLQALVERAMAKERDQRFASAAEMIAAVDAVLRAPALAPAPASQLSTRFARGLAWVARGTWRLLRGKVLPLLGRGLRALGRALLATLRFMGRALRAFFLWLAPRIKRAARWLWRATRAGVVRLFKRERAAAPALLPPPDMAAATVIDADLVSRVMAAELPAIAQPRAATQPYGAVDRDVAGEQSSSEESAAVAAAQRRALQEDATLDEEAAKSGSGVDKG